MEVLRLQKFFTGCHCILKWLAIIDYSAAVISLIKSNGNGSMSTDTSDAALKSTGAISDHFPSGLRVLVVDDNPMFLMIFEKMLKICGYKVTKCDKAESVLSLMRENKKGFDIVICDVHMSGMDGFKLLEHIGLEIDLPVIMISADASSNVIMKGITHGACDYLIKPVSMEVCMTIWQHIVRKRKNEQRDTKLPESAEEEDRQQNVSNESNWRNSNERMDEEEEANERGDTSTLKKPKKPRVVWSDELHRRFVAAVNQLGINEARPRKILALMNVPGLTRQSIGSHLQKYCRHLKRLSGVSQHQSYLHDAGLMGRNGIAGSTRAPCYNPVSQSFSLMNFSMNQTTTKCSIQEEVTDADITYHASSSHSPHVHSSIRILPSFLVQQSFSSNQQKEQCRDANAIIGTPMFSVSESMEQGTIQNQHLNTFVADNQGSENRTGLADQTGRTTNQWPARLGL